MPGLLEIYYIVLRGCTKHCGIYEGKNCNVMKKKKLNNLRNSHRDGDVSGGGRCAGLMTDARSWSHYYDDTQHYYFHLES